MTKSSLIATSTDRSGSMRKLLLRLVCCVWLILFLGCGDSGISIRGKITVNGEPLESAELKFLPLDAVDNEHVGAVVANGEFEVEDNERIKEGEYQVQVCAFRKSGKKVWDGMGDGSNKTMVDDFSQFIPNRYNDASELKVSLKKGENEFSTDLKVSAK